MLLEHEQHYIKLSGNDGYIDHEWSGYAGRPGLWHLWRRVSGSASISTDIDQIGFLYALVRMIKPELVMESGCNTGLTSYALGMACKDNGLGRVVTCDTDEGHCTATMERTAGLPVSVKHAPALDVPELAQCDFLYSDSSNASRIEEIRRVKKGCVVVMDDTLEPSLKVAVEGLGVNLPTPRGVTILRKC